MGRKWKVKSLLLQVKPMGELGFAPLKSTAPLLALIRNDRSVGSSGS